MVLVSHNMATIEDMCHKAAWLDHGRLLAIGDPKEVIAEYRKSQN
jgi:ABC-type polysaccharide/polyol phosphate transport system ATPase subunit